MWLMMASNVHPLADRVTATSNNEASLCVHVRPCMHMARLIRKSQPEQAAQHVKLRAAMADTRGQNLEN